MKSKDAKSAEETRHKILRAAFEEFYKNGFQGGSINHIVEKAGITKGALFHHFADKNELGYAVFEEVIMPGLKQRWLDPLASSIDPISDLKNLFHERMKDQTDSPCRLMQGCPLNNLAQEMSPLDEGFRKRINNLYSFWRESLASALDRGIKIGKVRKDISPQNVATFIVAAQMGIVGTAKNSQDPELLAQAGEALFSYLDTLKA